MVVDQMVEHLDELGVKSGRARPVPLGDILDK
jgi:hypothetical protein